MERLISDHGNTRHTSLGLNLYTYKNFVAICRRRHQWHWQLKFTMRPRQSERTLASLPCRWTLFQSYKCRRMVQQRSRNPVHQGRRRRPQQSRRTTLCCKMWSRRGSLGHPGKKKVLPISIDCDRSIQVVPKVKKACAARGQKSTRDNNEVGHTLEPPMHRQR